MLEEAEIAGIQEENGNIAAVLERRVLMFLEDNDFWIGLAVVTVAVILLAWGAI